MNATEAAFKDAHYLDAVLLATNEQSSRMDRLEGLMDGIAAQ